MDAKQQSNTVTSLVFSVPSMGMGFGIVSLFSLVVNVLVLAIPIYTLQLFDRVLGSRSVETLLLLFFAATVAIILNVLIDGIRAHILQRLGVRFELYYIDQVISRTLISSAREGAVSAQPLRDLVEVKQAISSPGFATLFDVPWMPVFILATFILHPMIGLLTTVGIVFLLLIAIAHALYVSNETKKKQVVEINALEKMQNFAQSAEAIVSMGIRDRIVNAWRETSDEILKKHFSVGRVSSNIQNLSKFVRLMLQIGVMAIGTYYVLQLELSAGAMIASSIVMARALAPAEHAIGSWRLLSSSREAGRRLAELMNASEPVRPSVPVHGVNGRLTINRVSFSRPGMTEPILQNINVAFTPGQIVGIVGPSGSGKSTLARLMVGALAPTYGSVQLDGADVTQRAVYDLGEHIGYLPQDVQLFEGSVVENISRLSDDDPVLTRRAAELVRIATFIDGLPDGFDTKLGPGGVQISAGERQRIGLARALYKKPRLIVLDEPDANLDVNDAAYFPEILNELKADGCTVIVISHRANLLEKFDRLIVMKDGRIEQDGTIGEVHAKLGVQSKPRLISTHEPQQEDDPASKGEGADQASLSIQPWPISGWPDEVKNRWIQATRHGKLQVDTSERRNQAVLVGAWLSFLNKVGSDFADPHAVEKADVFLDSTIVLDGYENKEIDPEDVANVLKALDADAGYHFFKISQKKLAEETQAS